MISKKQTSKKIEGYVYDSQLRELNESRNRISCRKIVIVHPVRVLGPAKSDAIQGSKVCDERIALLPHTGGKVFGSRVSQVGLTASKNP